MRSVSEIEAEIGLHNKAINDLSMKLRTAQKKESKKSSAAYHKRKKMLNDAAELTATFLKPGDYVKVTGSNTWPIRKLILIENGTITAYTCRKVKNILVSNNEIIQCGLNKVTHFLRDDI